jgi:hypothetical protein
MLSTLGYQDAANLDDGGPAAGVQALQKFSPAVEKKLVGRVKAVVAWSLPRPPLVPRGWCQRTARPQQPPELKGGA